MCRQRLEDMRCHYNAEVSEIGTPNEPPYQSVTEGWLAALQLNPARLIPNRWGNTVCPRSQAYCICVCPLHFENALYVFWVSARSYFRKLSMFSACLTHSFFKMLSVGLSVCPLIFFNDLYSLYFSV